MKNILKAIDEEIGKLSKQSKNIDPSTEKFRENLDVQILLLETKGNIIDLLSTN